MNDLTITYPEMMTQPLSNIYENKLNQIESYANVTLDLSKTTYVDSATLGSLISLKKRMKGKLEIICSTAIYYILVRMHITDFLNVKLKK
jgi:anti-anti-sigma regulatory factor